MGLIQVIFHNVFGRTRPGGGTGVGHAGNAPGREAGRPRPWEQHRRGERLPGHSAPLGLPVGKAVPLDA